MDELLITKLIELVETASPLLWAIARKQVTVWQIHMILRFLPLSACLYASYRFTVYARIQYQEDDDWGWGIALGICAAIATGIAQLNVIGRLTTLIINPDYAAIEALFSLIPK